MPGQTGITVEDVAARAGIGLDALANECSQTVLRSLADFCEDWRLIGKRLELTHTDVNDIDRDYRTEKEKRVGMLEKWREKFAFKAKYQTLVEALLAEGKSTDAIEACRVIGAAATGECTNVNDVQSNQKTSSTGHH